MLLCILRIVCDSLPGPGASSQDSRQDPCRHGTSDTCSGRPAERASIVCSGMVYIARNTW